MAALTVPGILLVILGLFAAGNLIIVVVGLVPIFDAGLLQVVGGRRS